MFAFIFLIILALHSVEGDPSILQMPCQTEADGFTKAFCNLYHGRERHRHPLYPKWMILCPTGLCELCSSTGVLEYNAFCDACVAPIDAFNPNACPKTSPPKTSPPKASPCDVEIVKTGCGSCVGTSAVGTTNPESDYAYCQCVDSKNICRSCAPGTKWRENAFQCL